jgi:hypothetical protein
MVIDDLRRSLAAAPRDRLPDITRALYAALTAREITETEAEEIEAAIQARRLLPPPAAPQRGMRPPPMRDARRERQRRWAASGWVTPAVAARLTPARAAVLAVVLWQVARGGDCRLCWAAVSDLAGVCVTTVKAALRDARALGVIATCERRHVGRRSETTVVKVIDRDIARWIERRGRSGGGGAGTPAYEYKKNEKNVRWGFRGLSGSPLPGREASRWSTDGRAGLNSSG